MSRIKDEMQMPINFHYVNKTGKGVALSIEGYKFAAKEGSDLCNLFRSIINGAIIELKRTIDVRHLQYGVLYDKHNETTLKRKGACGLFEQNTLFTPMLPKVDTGKHKLSNEKKDIVKSVIKETVKEEVIEKPVIKPVQKKTVKETVVKTPSPKINTVNIVSRLNLLKAETIKPVSKPVIKTVLKTESEEILKKINKETVEKKSVKETVSKPDIKTVLTPEEEIFKEYEAKIKELNIEKLTRDDARKYHIRTESSLFNKSHASFLKAYSEWKENQTKKFAKAIEAFKLYENKLNELNVEKINRDDARKYHIPYGPVSNNSYTIFLEMYNEWKMNEK